MSKIQYYLMAYSYPNTKARPETKEKISKVHDRGYLLRHSNTNDVSEIKSMKQKMIAG